MAGNDDELAHITVDVSAPADAIWRVLTDFGRPQRLAPTIDRCTVTGSGVGAVRIVFSSRGPIIHERLTTCDRSAWRFQYEVLDSGDMPFAGLTRYYATVTLTPFDAGRTIVDWRAVGAVDGDPAPARAAIEALYRGAIARLADAAAARRAGAGAAMHRCNVATGPLARLDDRGTARASTPDDA